MVIELLRLHWTLHTVKWSLKCTYRKMTTESIISFQLTFLSSSSIKDFYYELRACSECDQNTLLKNEHLFWFSVDIFLHDKTLSGVRLLSSLFISPSVCIHVFRFVFSERTILMMYILPFLCRLQAEIQRFQKVRLFKSKSQRSSVYSPYAGLSVTWHWTCQVRFSSK